VSVAIGVMPSPPRRTAVRAAVWGVAAVLAIAIAYDMWRMPIQVSDSLQEILDAQASTSALRPFVSDAGGNYYRPLRIAQIKALFDLSHGHYHLAYRGFHAALILLLVWLFTRALTVETGLDAAAAIFGLTVLTGLHTFLAFLREAFPINHFLEMAVFALVALNLSLSRGGWWADVLAALTFVAGALTLESGLLVWVVLAAAWIAGLRGVSTRGVVIVTVGARLPNDRAYTLAMAKDAKELGYRFLLDFHYANSWADPGKQPTPVAWTNLSHAQRVTAVFEYTRDTIAAFRDAGVLPDMVQVGNEITHGMLWPDGRLSDHWDNFAEYVYAGINGVDAGRGNGRRPRIMLHVDQGGSVRITKDFFDHVNAYGIPYDVIGLSYYPWWYGTIMDLRANLAFIAEEYGKEVIVVETAYNWRPNRETRDRLGPFPETPEGQRDFLDAVTRAVVETPHGRGKGVFWWEPAVVGPLGSRGFFDDDGQALPVLGVFDKYAKPVPRGAGGTAN